MSVESFRIRSLKATCYRTPLATPVVTSFGRMLNRPAVFIRLEDEDGVAGWGEAWCNFPSVGGEHRARLINDVLTPLIEGTTVSQPRDLFKRLAQQTEVLAIQSGEAGPFAHCIAGIDLALWDLYARRRKLPLWKLLGGTSPQIRVYASGINPTGSAAMAQAAMDNGHRAFKLKIGFEHSKDLDNLRNLRSLVGDHMLAADANQAWTLAQAAERVPSLAPFDLAWLEEPIRANRPRNEWRKLASVVSAPLAAGENVAGREEFAQLIDENVIGVIQPDAAKWGGLSECVDIGRAALKAGRRFCPHYLGGGIGLLASAHLLAAVGGDGLLEIDANDNPLRDLFCGPVANVVDGTIILNDEAGLGFQPDIAAIEHLRTA